jgi:hypothetical protein
LPGARDVGRAVGHAVGLLAGLDQIDHLETLRIEDDDRIGLCRRDPGRLTLGRNHQADRYRALPETIAEQPHRGGRHRAQVELAPQQLLV